MVLGEIILLLMKIVLCLFNEIGENIESILKFANDNGSIEYREEYFELATSTELYEYAKICGEFWRG